MTTADYQEYVVVCKHGTDYLSVWSDIETLSNKPNIPDRPVAIANDRNAWDSLCNYWLTAHEAENLKQDPRIEDVNIPLANLPDTYHLDAVQSGDFNKPQNPTNSGGLAINWGLIRHSYNYNVYGTDYNTDRNYEYILDGSGVDVVIWDSGIQLDHPEFTDASGQSRIRPINWYQAAGLPYQNLPTGFYTDVFGHGTAIAGVVAGKTFGWAKNADIYVMNSVPASSSSIPIDRAAELIKLWHQRKMNPANGPGVYTGRPTVVNASFGNQLSTITTVLEGGVYQGTPWTSNNWSAHWASKGINTTFDSIPLFSAENNRLIQDMQDAGIIVCKSAGNSGYKSSEIDANPLHDSWNTVKVQGRPSFFYMRGGSPYGSKTLIVGAITTVAKNASQDRKANYSNAGSLVKIYGASGGPNLLPLTQGSVMTAISTQNQFNQPAGWVQPYRGSGIYKQIYFSGTSTACPQIAGIAALYMQANPRATPANVYDWFTANASKNSLYKTGLDSDYTNMESQWGGDGGVAYQALQSLTWKPATISVTGSTTTVAVRVWNGSTWQPAYPFTT